MATLNSVLTKLQSLLQSLNGKTGRTDSTFNSAINALPSKKTINDVTVSGKTVTAPAGIYFSQVQMSVDGITLVVYHVSIKSNIGNCTAYYTAADGKQYTATITSTAQTIYVAEKTTLRVVSPSGTICELSGTSNPQINEGNSACLYLPAALNPNLAPAATITVVQGAKYGGLPVYDYSNLDGSYGGLAAGGYFSFDARVTTPTVFEDDVTIGVPKADFGDADSSSVVKGRTFTSIHGVCVEGDVEVYDGHYKPLVEYSQEDSNGAFFDFGGDSSPMFVEDCIDVLVHRTDFGNAKASDVRAGVTFTSADGVNITGTASSGGSDILVVSICDLDICGPYYITYIDRYGDQMTETLEDGDCRTFICSSGTTLTVEPAGQYSSLSLYYGDEVVYYNGPDVPLPSNVVECYIDIYG